MPKKFEFWISLIRQQIFWNTLWNSQMMESFISDFYYDSKIKKSQKSKHFLSKGKIKLFERPQTIGGESSTSHSPLKDFFDTWENEKNQIEPPFYNCDELELFFNLFLHVYTNILNIIIWFPQFSSTKCPLQKTLTLQNPWFRTRNN